MAEWIAKSLPWSCISTMNKCRRLLLLLVGLLSVLAIEGLVGEANAADRTPVEHVTKRPSAVGEGLGTNFYSPSEPERPFFNKLDAKEKTTGGHSEDYNLEAKDRKYVGWFGIVREITEDAAHDRTTVDGRTQVF